METEKLIDDLQEIQQTLSRLERVGDRMNIRVQQMANKDEFEQAILDGLGRSQS